MTTLAIVAWLAWFAFNLFVPRAVVAWLRRRDARREARWWLMHGAEFAFGYLALALDMERDIADMPVDAREEAWQYLHVLIVGAVEVTPTRSPSWSTSSSSS